MIGDILYKSEQDDSEQYAEMLLAEEGSTRLIVCLHAGRIALFRIEWSDQDSYNMNTARYELFEAIQTFRKKAGKQDQAQSDNRIIDAAMGNVAEYL